MADDITDAVVLPQDEGRVRLNAQLAKNKDGLSLASEVERLWCKHEDNCPAYICARTALVHYPRSLRYGIFKRWLRVARASSHFKPKEWSDLRKQLLPLLAKKVKG